MLALISGASRGIGAACALALAKEGCDIIINFKSDRTAAERTESRIGVLGRKTWLCRFDVSDPASVRAGCEKIINIRDSPIGFERRERRAEKAIVPRLKCPVQRA